MIFQRIDRVKDRLRRPRSGAAFAASLTRSIR
jgi:hypothetical protein